MHTSHQQLLVPPLRPSISFSALYALAITFVAFRLPDARRIPPYAVASFERHLQRPRWDDAMQRHLTACMGQDFLPRCGHWSARVMEVMEKPPAEMFACTRTAFSLQSIQVVLLPLRV